MARHAILDFVADDPQVIHMRILDGKTERRKSQWPNLEFAGRERSDDRRRAFKASGFRDIGAAEMGQELFFLKHQRAQRCGHDHPTDPHLEGPALGTCAASRRQGCGSDAANPELATIDGLFHVISPLFRAGGL